MTIKEAERIRNNYDDIKRPTEDEFFLFTEAMKFLIEERKSLRDMVYLGEVYKNAGYYEIAYKYFEMAANDDYIPALGNLGQIWLYGDMGEIDYEKAFNYFSRAAELGDITCAYQIAEMYKYGHYVEKSYDKYKEIIRNLYTRIKDTLKLIDPLPEVFIRLAEIYVEENCKDEAVELYLYAKEFLSQRIAYGGDYCYDELERLTNGLYSLIPFDNGNFNFYDAYYLLKNPAKIRFRYKNKSYIIEAVEENEECVIRFEDKWFRTREDLFKKAEIGGKPLTVIYNKMYMFEVI